MAKVSEAGVAMIQEFEGCVLSAYKDTGGVWTIGYGHTGADVYEGLIITQATADALLQADLAEFETGVEQMLMRDVSQEQFDALVSYAYNCGLGALSDSQMFAHVNRGDDESAVQEWTRGWEDAEEGLQRRRQVEADLYESG